MSLIFAIRVRSERNSLLCVASFLLLKNSLTGAWALMLMIDVFYSLTNVQSFWLASVQLLYKTYFFCHICTVASTERLRIMEWEVTGCRGPGAFPRDLHTVMYAWLCGKRWKRPSIVIVTPLRLWSLAFFVSSRYLTIVSSSAKSDRTKSRLHGQDMYHQEWLQEFCRSWPLDLV
jgi:hypothetical protein